VYATRRATPDRLAANRDTATARRARSATPAVAEPNFIVWAEAGDDDESNLWRVVIRTPQGRQVLEVADCEPDVSGERLQLLAAVRGLEALDRPSQVVLVTSSRYVRRGLLFGLEQWRQNGWRWESYGQLVPVKNVDLWQRLDRAIHIHRVQTGGMRWLHQTDLRFDPPQTPRPTDRVRNAYRLLRQRVATVSPASEVEGAGSDAAATVEFRPTRRKNKLTRQSARRGGHGIPAPHCDFRKAK
jgi:ribonuclease HI